MSAHESAHDSDARERAREREAMGASPLIFWGLTAIGGAVLLFAIVGFFQRQIPPGRWGFWSVGALVLHDAIIAPLYLLLAFGLRRVVPAVVRPPVTAGLALTGMLGLYAWPVLRRYGDAVQDGNATILPGNYTSGLLTVLVLVWLACAAWAVLRVRASSAD